MKGFRPGWRPKQVERTPVILAMLTMRESTRIEIMDFLIHCLTENANPECPYAFGHIHVDNISPVAYARNQAVQSFRKVADKMPPTAKLWWIDSDMVPPVNYREQLALDSDMGAGRAYGIISHQLFTCIQRKGPDGRYHHLAVTPDSTEIATGDASGTGGLWVTKKILDDERMWLTPEGDVFRTLYHPNGQVEMSEDIDFTSRAVNLGYTLKAHMGCKWGHFKEVDLLSLEGKAGSTEMQTALESVFKPDPA
jgi:hypothetical protein